MQFPAGDALSFRGRLQTQDTWKSGKTAVAHCRGLTHLLWCFGLWNVSTAAQLAAQISHVRMDSNHQRVLNLATIQKASVELLYTEVTTSNNLIGGFSSSMEMLPLNAFFFFRFHIIELLVIMNNVCSATYCIGCYITRTIDRWMDR